MSGVAAGELRHKVELQALVVTQDPNTGEMVNTWTTIAEPWAKIAPLSAREFLAASAEQSEVRAKITIRYRQGVNATMRIVYRGLYYGIIGVMADDFSMLEHQTIMVSEGVRLDQ